MNNLKKIILFSILLTSSFFYAQREVDREKIQTLKIAFITEKLSLSSKEAQNFWPIYNSYQDEKEALRIKENTDIKSKISNASNLTEKEAVNLLQKVILHEEEENKVFEKFMTKVTTVISAKKMLLLLQSEQDFKRQLIRQYHEKNRKNEP